MGKAARKRKRQDRTAQKRQRKASMKAQFEAWTRDGINQKSRRPQKNKAANQTVRLDRHRKRSKVEVVIVQVHADRHSVRIQPVTITQKQHRNTMKFKTFMKSQF